MLFETILIFSLFLVSFFFIGLPIIRLIKLLIPIKRDPLKDARVRLEVAKTEAEAAKLNKEAEKVYSQLYAEALDDDEVSEKEGSRKL